VEYDFTAALEKSSTASPTARHLRQVLKEFWVGFIGAVNDIKDLRVAEGARCARRHAGPAHLPPARMAAISGSADLRHRRNNSRPESSAPCRLLELSECRYTRPLAADSGASADRVLGKDRKPTATSWSRRQSGPIQLGEQKDYAEGENPGAPAFPEHVIPPTSSWNSR
jgi:DNA topoisomerase-1